MAGPVAMAAGAGGGFDGGEGRRADAAARAGSRARAAAVAAVAAGALAALLAAPAGAQRRLTADEVVKLALERSPTALTAREETRAASGRLLAARSQILPQLDVNGQWSKSSEETFFFPPGATSFLDALITDESTSGSVTLNQSLVSLASWAQIRSASGLRDAARERDRATRADVALEAYRQYFALLKAHKFADVTRLSVDLRRDQLARTQALFELGSVARGDVLKQQVTVSQAQLDDIAAQQNIVVQRALLAAVVGLETGEPVEIDTTLTEVRIEVDSVAVLRDALQQRPELAEFRARRRAAEAGLGAAQAGRYPSFGAGYRYNFRTPGFASSFNEIDNFDESAGFVTLSWALFDGLFSKGRIREARARKLQAQYALRESELRVVVEVQQALQAATQASEQIQVARAGLDAAEEDLKLTQEKYNVGSATVIELIDSQVALTRAQVQYINAVADAHVAEMQLARARGQRF